MLKDIPKVEENIEVHKVYTPNVKLESVGVTADTSVPGSWEWVQPNTPVVCPGGTYACRFVPDDLINYECVVRDIKVVVDKAEPYIYDLDTTRITYGQTIGDSEIIAEVHHSEDDEGKHCKGSCAEGKRRSPQGKEVFERRKASFRQARSRQILSSVSRHPS